MKLLIKSLIIVVFFNNNVFCQNTFEILVNSQEDEILYKGIETKDNFIFVGGYGKSTLQRITQSGYIIKIDKFGKISKELKVSKIDTSIVIKDIIKVSDSEFITFSIGGNSAISTSDLLIYHKFNNSLDILDEKIYKIPFADTSITDFKSLINSNSNIILSGYTKLEASSNFEMFFWEFNINGDSINSNFVHNETSSWRFAYNLIEKNDKTGYYCLAKSHEYKPSLTNAVLSLNNNLKIISHRMLPVKIDNAGILQWFTDTTYIATGIKNINGGVNDRDLGVIVIDTLHVWSNYNSFGTPDYNEIISQTNSLEYNINDEFIYLSGTSGYDIFNGSFSSNKSYIYFVKLDRNLNPIFEKFYKGDACYYSTFMLRAKDNGFVFISTRYDYTIQNNERDIHILKVDENGNLPASTKTDIEVSELIIFPNPASNEIQIRIASQVLGGKLYVYNILGKLITQKNITKRYSKINISNLPAGTYIYKYAVKNKQVANGKFVKE